MRIQLRGPIGSYWCRMMAGKDEKEKLKNKHEEVPDTQTFVSYQGVGGKLIC